MASPPERRLDGDLSPDFHIHGDGAQYARRRSANGAARCRSSSTQQRWGNRFLKFGVIPGAVQREAVRRRPGIGREVWSRARPAVSDLRSSIACCIASGTTRMLKIIANAIEFSPTEATAYAVQ